MRTGSLFVFLLFSVAVLHAQQAATVREYDKEYRTYPFADPDPVPDEAQQPIYPYFRYDGFTNTAINKKWKVVELQNDYIAVTILPEIGGKIWSAKDKKNNRFFIYNNDVVK